MDLYFQCVLVKETRSQVAWVPAKYSKIGKTLRVRDKEPGNVSDWEDGWIVQEIGMSRTKDQIPDLRVGQKMLSDSERHRKRK